MLGERFCQAISERLEQDGLIVIVCRFEFIKFRFNAQSRGNGEQANMILEAALSGGDVIGQATVGVTCCFVSLLTEKIQGGPGFPVTFTAGENKMATSLSR